MIKGFKGKPMFSEAEAQLIAESLHAVARSMGLNQPGEQRDMSLEIIAKLKKSLEPEPED